MIYDNYITMDPYGLDNARVVWNSLDAQTPAKGPKVNHINDPPEQAARCLTCPIPPEEAHCGDKCWYRLGREDPAKKTGADGKPYGCPKHRPRGYNEKKMERILSKYGGICDEAARELGISRQRMRSFVLWHEHGRRRQ